MELAQRPREEERPQGIVQQTAAPQELSTSLLAAPTRHDHATWTQLPQPPPPRTLDRKPRPRARAPAPSSRALTCRAPATGAGRGRPPPPPSPPPARAARGPSAKARAPGPHLRPRPADPRPPHRHPPPAPCAGSRCGRRLPSPETAEGQRAEHAQNSGPGRRSARGPAPAWRARAEGSVPSASAASLGAGEPSAGCWSRRGSAPAWRPARGRLPDLADPEGAPVQLP